MKKNAQLKILVQCLICALTYTRKKFEAYWIKHFGFTDRRIFLYFSVPQPQNLAQKFILVQKVFISSYFTSGYYFIMICMHIKAYIANLVFHLCTTLRKSIVISIRQNIYTSEYRYVRISIRQNIDMLE